MRRELWLDYLRAFACILVTLGHLLMSLEDADVIKNVAFSSAFVSFIYCFHVYIFFFCSGYLFQKSHKGQLRWTDTLIPRLEKCINFLILYVVFSGITYVIKVAFSSDVNSAVDEGFIDVLLTKPINQMWYLYAISAIFLFAHFVHSQRSLYITLGIACVLKIVICIPPSGSVIPVPVNYLFDNLIWFTLGQAFAYRQIRWNKSVPLLLGALFVLLFIPAYVLGWSSGFLSALLTLLGVLASVGCVNILTRDKAVINGVWKYASKYMLQIYLLHTICAAGIRIVLLKIGVAHLLPHLLFGIVFSYVLPVICAVIAERVTILNVFFFPVKTVKGLLHKKQV